jgi:glucose/arabinose dehydrogenase
MNTEHGPKGGDEVNFNFLNNDKMKNFGWPISSFGKPYPGTENIFEKEGWLKKSHSENNFNEPIKYFVPSIGISELIYVDDYKDLSGSIFASSLRAGSIYILNIDKNMKKILDTDRIFFKNKRIRDLKYDKKSKLFFILFENTPSVGVLKVN